MTTTYDGCELCARLLPSRACDKHACEQCWQTRATVYAIDPAPGGWGGRYCRYCANSLGFRVVDVIAR